MTLNELTTMTREELAALLRISERTLKRKQAAGLILTPLPLSSPHQPRWLSDDVREWLRAGAPAAADWSERKVHSHAVAAR